MKIIKKLSIALSISILSIVLIFIGMWIYFASSLDISKITEINQTIDIMDKDGYYVTGVYSKENRTKIDISSLPDHVKNAFIAIEDSRFYKHIGIDIKRIFGAALSNIKSGGLNEGASTITQQLIKLSHLSSKKTITRKIKEAFLALELERRYTKDEILEMYLNYCYLGNGSYGIEAGAKKYFGVSASELTISQSALLAGILKSPSKYAPHINPENSFERRNLVLKQMMLCGFITNNQYNVATKEQINLIQSVNEPYPYGYYIDTVLYETEQLLGINSEDLLKEGYTIYTSMDINAQKAIENAVKIELPKDENGNMPEASMVVLTSSGEIAAIVGGKRHAARRGINRAMDIKRSPGSTIKPVLVYAPAYEYKEYTNATFVLDEKQDFNGYTPSNAGNKYYGWVTTKEALSKSLNVPAVKILNDVGVNNAINYCKSVGIEFTNDDNHLALALGGFSEGVTPLQISASYLPFTNGGNYIKPSAIRKIVDKEGNIIYESQTNKSKVLSEQTAFLITELLREAVKSGTAKQLNSLNIPIAAKTGTSNKQNTSDSRDAWAVSYTTDYICTAWIGYDSGDSLPKGISGGTYPTQMAMEFFKDIYSDSSPADFQIPPDIVKVRLDKKLLKENKKAAIASSLAPDEMTISEYFTKSTVPSEKSDNWNNLGDITGFSVNIDKDGYPVIHFNSEYNNINYTIMRNSDTGQVPIFQTSGQNKKISYKDTSVIPNKKYEYYILAMINDLTKETNRITVAIDKTNNEEVDKTKSEEKTSSDKPTTNESTNNKASETNTISTTLSP